MEAEVVLEMQLAAQYYHNMRTNLRLTAKTKYGVLHSNGTLMPSSWAFWFRKKYVDLKNKSPEQQALRSEIIDLEHCAIIYQSVPDTAESEAMYVGRGKNKCKSIFSVDKCA